MPSSSDASQQLRDLLKRQAILYSSPTAPITHRTGEISAWAFYSWNITLTESGLRLAAWNILEALKTFGSTQLASYGYTGLPLLSACILEGGGRYSGLSIREKRKTHLTNRRVDGVIDHSQPVVIIDDSLSSGTSLYKAITALEEEGLEVEGSIALVHFPYRGAKEWANTAGYRTLTLFDVWTDLEMAEIAEPYPGADRTRVPTSSECMPDGLNPAVLARRVAEVVLRTRQMPRWPARLDDSYDARGGTFVSFRQRSNDDRVARDGFWHFDPGQSDSARDVVLATAHTLETADPHALTLASLADLKIAVTFFGPLEEIPPSELDFNRYGIVVRSKVWPDKLGGALPNTQVFISDIEQYRHARRTNARVADTEPHTLYRHRVAKVVEPGETWLPYGCEETSFSWWPDERVGRLLTSRARDAILSLCGRPPNSAALTNSLVPTPVEGVAVTLYTDGLCGYGLSYESDLDRAIGAAASAAWRDPRNEANRSRIPDDMALTVSVLHDGEPISGPGRLLVERKLRRGLDAVTLLQEGRQFTVLPSALVYNDWSRGEFLDALEAMAGGRRSHHAWRTHQVVAWVSERGRVLPLRFGFPARESRPSAAEDSAAAIDLLASYIARSIGPDGIPAYQLAPRHRDYVRVGTAARVLHGLYALRIAGDLRGRSDWMDAAASGVFRCLQSVRHGAVELPNHVGGALADVLLLAAASVCGGSETAMCADVAERVAGFVHRSGWIGEGQKRLDNPQDQDYLPGATVWALASYCRATGKRLPTFLAARRFYGNRMREHRTWGCSWLAQGWAAVHDLTHERADAEIAFIVGDWVAGQQLTKSGAFLDELSPDEPSFNTGFVAEGIAGAWRAALARSEMERSSRYEASWRKAVGFVRTLTLEETDVFPFRAPQRAVGGVRCSLSRASIRIDQVSHSLHALVEGHRNLLGALALEL